MRRLCLLFLAGWIAFAGVGRAQLSTLAMFSGQGTQNTDFFTVADKWEVQWQSPDLLAVTVLGPDGVAVAGTSGTGSGTLFLAKGGKYYLQVTRAGDSKEPWHASVFQIGTATNTTTALASNVPTNAASATPPPPAELTEQQAHAVVVIKGDVAEGTGFLVKGPDGPAVVTNLHVLSANPHIKVLTTTGEQIKTAGLKGASDRDLAMISIVDNHYTYLDLATDIPGTVENGDEVITPGNSEGGEVVLDTKGTVLGVGPERIEFSNPIYHGNSGGPVFHVKSGKVIAVVTQALKVRTQDALDKASFENKNSAIIGSMRYFGLRLDTVPKWETYDWAQFLNETNFINNFHDLSRCLDSYMNGARYERAQVATSDEYGPPTAQYYLKNQKIQAAHDNFHRMSVDAGDSQRIDAAREMVMDLQGIANTDMTAIQNPSNFYSFDQIRTAQEVKYRQALEKEIEGMGDKISDLGH